MNMDRLPGFIYGYITLTVASQLSITRPIVGSMNNNLHGIGHISITTDDLESSTRFYTAILGGMLIADLSYRYHGDQHYYLMFEKEITEARIKGVDPSELGVPDISNNGTYEVRGNFIVFDNGLVQLQTFVQRGIRERQIPFEARETRTSPGFVTAPHICFLITGDADFNHYLVELEKKSRANGFANVNVNPTVNVNSEQERQRLPESKFGLTFNEGGYAGASFDYVKGPSGEQLEFLQLTGNSRINFGKAYCKRRSVSSEFLNSYNDNTYKARAGNTGKLQGIIQFGTRSYGFLLSTEFYVDILGGFLLGPPLLGENIRGDAVYSTIFQKELLDARRQGVPAKSIGIPDISDTGLARFDIRFVLFDNYVVETIQYTNGRSLDDQAFNPRYNWSSPAYINTMAAAFHLHEDTDFHYYLKGVELRAQNASYVHVRLNKCPDSVCTRSLFPLGSALEGYRYAYVKGPSGEQLVFTQFRGHVARVLKQALLEYGALNTAFDETNPWKHDAFRPFCNQYDALSASNRSVSSLFLGIAIINVLIKCRSMA